MSKRIKIKVTLQEDILGTSPNDKDIYETFIGSKAPDKKSLEEEVNAIGVDEVVAQKKTVFPKMDDGTPFMWDYQVRGFFKDACGMLQRVTTKDETTGKKKKLNESGKITAYKKVIDGLIFVFPRKIPIISSDEIGSCQRPLRASTPQGERIALANSESIPAGATLEFEVLLLAEEYEKAVLEWLDYGALRGLGQWRNSGKGRFTYEILS